ncbi:MAG: carbohydrate ABC transporter permease [Clostridia bacterium]|nr:carbohydrate ABC transporter permease [Clostridia bacterium]
MAKDTMNKSRVNRSLGGDIMVTLMLVLVGAFMALPLYLSVVNAFKPLDEIFIYPPRFYVMKPTTTNFKQLFQMTSNLWVPFSRYVFNSVFVTIVVTISHVILASMAAYPLAKHKFPGNKGVFKFVQTALLFTGGTIALPQYIIMAFLGMVDTYWALILPSVASALGLFLMKQFMEPIGDAMLEAAKIDGASEWRIWWQIVMPIVKPAWLTLSIFAFQSIWNATGNNFIYSEQLKLLPTVLTQIQAGGIARTGVAAAASLVLLIPPVLFFVITQSNVLETMAHSGMKD